MSLGDFLKCWDDNEKYESKQFYLEKLKDAIGLF